MSTFNYALNRLERLYLMLETTFGVIPASAFTNGSCCRHIKVTMHNEVALLTRKDKTGSRTITQGVAGRKTAKWTTEMSNAPNGTAGVIPDCDSILQSLFGQAATVTTGTVSISGSTNATPVVITAAGHGIAAGATQVINITGHTGNVINGLWLFQAIDSSTGTLLGSAGTGVGTGGSMNKAAVEYTPSDTPLLTFSMASYRQPSTLSQRVAMGCVATSAEWKLGEDIATWTANGEALWVNESDQFSSEDLTQQGGWTAFAAEPASPVTNGGIIAGFTGRIVVDGTTIATIRTASVKFGTGSETIKDLFGSYYADSVEADERNVSVSVNYYDNDGTAAVHLRALGNSRTPVNIVLQQGTFSGSTMFIYLKGVQLPPTSIEDGQRRFVGSISDARAAGSSPTAKDELAIWFA